MVIGHTSDTDQRSGVTSSPNHYDRTSSDFGFMKRVADEVCGKITTDVFRYVEDTARRFL